MNQSGLSNVFESQVFAYTLMRAVSSPRLFNVCAMSEEGELLYVVAVDLEFEQAAEQVELMNKSFNELVE